MTTSIILPVHIINQELLELTVNTLNSIGQTENREHTELIIIDNASSVGGDILQSVATTYIRNKENVGYPRSINQGEAISCGDLLAITNNDIRVSSNWLTVAKDILFENDDVVSVHFRMINYEDDMKIGNRDWITGRERWCTSSFFVIRKKAFVGYDERYGLGGYDDWSFWYRVREKGWKTAYTTRACYQHKHSSTQLALSQGERKERDSRNRELFKQEFGKYAEDIWNDKYPDQMSQNYYEFFNTL